MKIIKMMVLALGCGLFLFACDQQPSKPGVSGNEATITKSEFDGLSFLSVNGKSAAILDKVAMLDVAYSDKESKSVQVFSSAASSNKGQGSCADGCRIDQGFAGKLLVPQKKGRTILVRLAKASGGSSYKNEKLFFQFGGFGGFSLGGDIVLICNDTQNPCAVTDEGCSGEIDSSGDQSLEDILEGDLVAAEQLCDMPPVGGS